MTVFIYTNCLVENMMLNHSTITLILTLLQMHLLQWVMENERKISDQFMHLSMSCRQGEEGRAWGGDLIVFVGPGIGHLTDLVLPGEGIFESFFAQRGDIWLPTRMKKTETEHMFPASTLHACAVRSGKIWKSWRPTGTSESWVDFTVLSSNFICFCVFLINWTS